MAYIDDLMEQPAALNRLLDHVASDLGPGALNLGSYDLIVVTGMGGSHFANYYLWRRLHLAGLPVQWVSTDELLSFEGDSWSRGRTLLWVSSQSGLSGEVSELIARHGSRPGVDVLAVTNSEGLTPLTERADYVQHIMAGPEATVGTKTYTNTVVANELLATTALGGDAGEPIAAYRQAATGITDYLNGDWRGVLAPLASAAGDSKAFVIVGRGSGHGTALEGALVLKEAVNMHVEGLSAGQFRHGPLELADPGLLLWFVAGGAGYAELDRAFVNELVGFGAHVAVTGLSGLPQGAFDIPAPAGPAIAEPIRRIIPIQLAASVIAEALGLQPGVFRNNRKVTTAL